MKLNIKYILILSILVTLINTTHAVVAPGDTTPVAPLVCTSDLPPGDCIKSGGTPKEAGLVYYCECSVPQGTPNTATIGEGGKWNWAAGYKFRTTESFDPAHFFKKSEISTPYIGPDPNIVWPGTPDPSLYVNMSTGWDINQSNWGTVDGCGSLTTCPEELDNSDDLPPGEDPWTCGISGGDPCYGGGPPDDPHNCGTLGNEPCFSEEPYCTGERNASYTCKSDINVQLKSSLEARRLQGGDTMYGTWGMLLGFFAPTIDPEDCSKDGRCFVGNAYIIDTHAQFEKEEGMLTGFGKKVLEEGPGDVYFFDQLRALATAPDYVDIKDLGKPIYNVPRLVGNWEFCMREVPPSSGGGLCNVSGTPFEAMAPVLEAAASKYGISPALLAAVLYNEGATSRSYWDWTPENVAKWSSEGGMPNCDDSLEAAQGPYQFLKVWWEPVKNASGCSQSASRCNFLDASFAAAQTLSATGGGAREKIKRYYCGYSSAYCNTQTAEDYANQGLSIYNLYKCN